MSVIQTIRNKYGKIAGGVIAVALVGFIVSDARNGSLASMFGGRNNNVVVVNGTEIDVKEYQTSLKEYETLYTMFNRGRSLDDASRAQMNEQVLQSIVYEAVAGKQCDKLGIRTTAEEENELIYGMNADPIVKQFQIEGQQIFISQQTGQFDPNIVKYMEKQFKEDPAKIDPNGKLQEQWNAVVSYVKRMSRINKFNTLIGASAYAPLYQAQRLVADQTAMASIRYVKVPFNIINDADVKVTDEELKAYMEKHSALYKADQPARSIEYVSFDIVPAAADTMRALQSLESIKADFAATKDNKSFVNNKSEEQGTFSEAYFNKRTFMAKDADTIMGMPVGEVYGPYYENGSYKLTKVVDRKTYADSVKVRHILIKTKAQGQDVAVDTLVKARIDSIMAAINAGASFDSMLVKYTEDKKEDGGSYWFTLQAKVGIDSAFGEFTFNHKVGDRGIVKANNGNYSGYHIMEIMEVKGEGPSIQLATVTKSLVPSDSTVTAIYGKANEFAGRNQTAAAFDDAVKKQGYDKRIGDNIKVSSFVVPGIGAAREVIKWMFEHKVGDVSQVFQLGEQRYVVAKLTAISEKGTLELNAGNRGVIEQRVKEEKRAELIKKKVGSATSLDAIAQTTGQTVGQADSIMLGGAYVPNLGYEPKVVGYAFCKTFQPNTVSAGIKGMGGVYYITVLSRSENTGDPNMMQQMVMQQRQSQDMQMRNALQQTLQPSVSRAADVKYNPANF